MRFSIKLLLYLAVMYISTWQNVHAQTINTPVGKLPHPAGPFVVGTKVFYMKDPKRTDTLQHSKWDVIVQAWYPCSARTKGIKMDYAPDKRLVDYFLKNHYYDIDSTILKSFYTLKTNSYKNAAILNQGKFPVLFFSPGFGTTRIFYTSICEALASNGIIVLEIDHLYEGATILPNGKAIDNSMYPDTTNASLSMQCVRDIQFVIDEVERPLSAIGKLFYKNADFNNIGASGHSYGGNLAIEMPIKDKRVKYSINLDGGDFSNIAGMKLTAPTLIVRERPNYTDDELRKKGRDPVKWKADSTKSLLVYFDALNTSEKTSYLVKVNQTGHFSFSDALYLMPSMLTHFLGTYLTPGRNLQLVSNLMLTFIQSATSKEKLNNFGHHFAQDKELTFYKVH